MSAGDVVCTGWLIKSPPEKKLKRYAWRKRWFVLRRGRMSGNPDVLEYYRNNHSKKPIRVIDLNDCEVQKNTGLSISKKQFQNNFVFIVKTSCRTFYLVAKTEEEMQTWVHNIHQICNFGHLEDGTDSVESLSQATSSPQPSPAASIHMLRTADPSFSGDSSAGETPSADENRSESESSFPPDYLFLSNCETGKFNHIRCDSWSNSDKSLEQNSSDDVFVDSMQPQPSINFLSSTSSGLVQQDLVSHLENPSGLARDLQLNGSSPDFSSSSPLLGPPLTPPFLTDKSQSPPLSGGTEPALMPTTPPPRPPKPVHFSEGRPEMQASGYLQNGQSIYRLQPGTVPRRISLSSLDNVRNWKADWEGTSLRSRDKRLSLNLPRFAPLSSFTTDGSEDSYVPMNPNSSPPASASDAGADGYIPMSPVLPVFTSPAGSSPKVSSPLPELPADLEPPPVNRDLKPRRKMRPPPLDLRSLSTIREHPALTRTWTVPYNRTSFISSERDSISSAGIFASSDLGEVEESNIQTQDQWQSTSLCNGAFLSLRKVNLDYLALDFNSASPSPVQKKPFFPEEERVDYVQVDEQKTQALQNTKQEWTDERQSKA
ncbi:GRB2-associated-binding protein 3 isoform X1 [Microcaecilia unicolor]|uniref:GRB2-associated-binding protein 3 isoform X1 n=2 Tax=Microcaecilia unicolor TaxID=1415580 RepID=A0A6P7YJW1_9AMPH|nr:GRB2-associated-binding protein 3 isoform X1 [Microcaecilia unicolor]